MTSTSNFQVFHSLLCPLGHEGYMKELMVSSSSSFILCCVRWPDMAVIYKSQ